MDISCVMCGRTFQARRDAKTCSPACRIALARGRAQVLGHAPVKMGESKHKGNCVPLAISEATGLAFFVVERMLLDAGGDPHKQGYLYIVWGRIIERLGFREVKDAPGKLLDASIVEPGGTYLAWVRGHLICVRANERREPIGMGQKRRRRLIGLWRLMDPGEK